MALRPDLNGLRVQQYGDPRVHLVDEGRKRWIPSPAVMGFFSEAGPITTTSWK